jgi:hypothetical protein
MHTKEVLSRSNELLPATSHIQAVGGVVDKFRQEIELLVSELDRKGMNAAQFGSFLSSLHGLVNGLGVRSRRAGAGRARHANSEHPGRWGPAAVSRLF